MYSSVTDALSQLGWLNLNQRRHFHRCLYVYKCVNGNGITSYKLELSRNSDVHKYNTRSKDHLRLPTVKRNWGTGVFLLTTNGGRGEWDWERE